MSNQTSPIHSESLSVPHSLWWGKKEINAKGENLELLRYVKLNDGPVIEINGELQADSDNYHWEYDTNLLSTKIYWIKK